MKRMLLVAVAVLALAGCWHLTRDQANAASTGGGILGSIFGIPRPVGELLVSTILAPLVYTAGHQRGRRRERPHPTPPPADKAAA